MRKIARIKISARKTNGLFFERYEYSPGAVEPLPFHFHPEYQFSFSPNAVGAYFCRRAKFAFAPQTLSIIHSGEKHAPDDKPPPANPKTYCLMYVAPAEILSAAREIGWRAGELPYFKEFLIADRILIEKYVRLFGNSGDTRLSEDIAKLDFLTYLTKNFAQNDNSVLTARKHPAGVKLAREFLDANFARAVSLGELSQIAGVGKYYLCREFRRAYGFTLNQYQNQLRMNAARRMLLNQNKPLSEISLELGYCDQSHFGRNFKRHVGTAPKFYSTGAISF